MDEQKYDGSCLCGTVRFEFRGPLSAFRYCHCGRCRKASGSAHAANIIVPAEQFQWRAGEESVKRYDLPQAERFSVWFCGKCGSRVPHRIRTRGDYLVPAGVVDDALLERPDTNIFWASHADWYVQPEELPKHAQYPA
ncbi:MAG: GFA family protein [Rhodospirillaceae bacterium]